MSEGGGTIVLGRVSTEAELGHARHLFGAYASEFASSIAESLSSQGFEAELAQLPGRYAPPSGCLLLARDGEHSAGCVALRDLGEGTCEMKRLYVAPVYRGTGLGRRLAGEIVLRAERMGYRRMVLDTLPEMTGALLVYRSLGFTETGRYWDNPIGRTIFLEKALGGRDERHPARVAGSEKA
jgi:putative acetyltransferase